MARPRKPGREHLPPHLRVQIRGGKEYFAYVNPLTGKSMALGYDSRTAIDFAIRANRGVIDPVVERDHLRSPQNDLLPYQELADMATDSRGKPGVYFLFQGDLLVYIGKSADVEFRIGQHRNRKQMQFDRVAIIRCGMAELSRLEARYIRKYTPAFNSTLPIALGDDEKDSDQIR